MSQHDRGVPYSHEAEIAVLGGMLMDPEGAAKGAEELSPDDFYNRRHRTVFRAMVRLFDRDQAIDPVVLSEEMTASGELDAGGGLPFLAELLDAVPTAANISYHARIVKDRALERALIRAGQEIVEDGMAQDGRLVAEKLDRAAERVFGLAESTEADKGPVWVKKLIYPVVAELEERMKAPAGMTGVPSGFHDLDEMTGGFQRGDLILLAARPSMGKTAIVTGMALHAAIMHQTPVAIYSLEMGKEQIVQRMLCYEALVDLGRFIRGRMTDDDLVRVAQAAGHINTAPIYIDDRGSLNVTQVRASVRRLKRENPDLGMVILDYVQLMAGGGEENRQQEVSQISRGLKSIAKEVNVAFIALSQLSRAPEQRTDHRPQLSDLRESGALEQDADLVMFLYRPERYMTPAEAIEKEAVGKAELIIGKQRNGPTGTVDLYFRKESTRFESLTRREDPDTFDRHQRTVTSHA